VKWAEGGLQYDSLKAMPADEIMALLDETKKINEAVKREMNKGG